MGGLDGRFITPVPAPDPLTLMYATGLANLDDRAAILGDGSHWSLQFREGAVFSNAGTCRKGSADDTVFWAWRDAGGRDPSFGCAVTLTKGDTIGTGCSSAGPSYK